MLSSGEIINKLMSGKDYDDLSNLYTLLLESDYKAAIEFSNQCDEDEFYNIIKKCDANRLEDILVKNGFSYNKDSSINLTSNHSFFLACLKKDAKSAFEYFVDISSLYDVPSKKLEGYAKYASFDDLSRDGIKKVCRFLNAISYSEDNRLIIDILDNHGYSLDLENKLLQKLGVESLEDKLIDMYEKDMRRKDMSIYDLLVLEMYAKRKLHEKGIDYSKIDIINGLKKDAVGNFSDKKGIYEITISNEDMHVVDLVTTILHEVQHAIQKHNRKNCDMIADSDIDLYSKDGFLGIVMKDRNYNQANYYRLSDEFDAEFSAYIETLRLFGGVDKEYEYYKNLIGKKDVSKDDKLYKSLSYSFDMYRRVGLRKYHINELMEQELSNYMMRTLDGIGELRKKYPIFMYEYDFSDKYHPKRKSIEQLFDGINRSNDKKDKLIYKCLLKSRFDIRKEKTSDIKQNVEEILYLVSVGSVNEEVANMLLGQIKDATAKNKKVSNNR